jgi:uncharacterized membrane protein YphA (DoxX/SURF4 family)
MKDWFLTRAFGLALPLIIGPLAFVLTQQLKSAIAVLDAAPPRVKQAVVLALSFLLAGAVKFAGGYLPSTCASADETLACVTALTDPEAMQVIVSALLAFALHAGRSRATE